MSTTATTEAWPNKGLEMVRVAIAMAVLSAVSTIWRLALRFRFVMEFIRLQQRHSIEYMPQFCKLTLILRLSGMGSSDWLMFAGTASSFVCNIPFILRCVDAGAGRLKADPFWTPELFLNLRHWQFVSIALQTYGMFFVKLSICNYLLALNFSPRFRVIMWIITIIVVTFNLVLPLLLQFASCRPFYYRWHADIVPECWSGRLLIVTEYAQIISNITTDLAYACAPLVYLREADLTKHMRIKVRLMFLLALAGTAASITKLIKLYKWLHSNEPYYDVVDLGIWGVNEIAICIIVANLPIQRIAICNTIIYLVPEYLHSRFGIEYDTDDSQGGSYRTTVDIPRQTRSAVSDADDNSELAIIELENGRIVMAPRTPTSPGQAVTRNRRSSAGTLMTFWRNDSKDSVY